jgi:hypothetical protein
LEEGRTVLKNFHDVKQILVYQNGSFVGFFLPVQLEILEHVGKEVFRE